MVQAIININEEANRVLMIIKAKFGLKDKSEAIQIMAQKYEQEILEPALRPEYIQEAQKISRGKFIKVGSLANLKKRYE